MLELKIELKKMKCLTATCLENSMEVIFVEKLNHLSY